MTQDVSRLRRKAEIVHTMARCQYSECGDVRKKEKADKLGRALRAMDNGMSVFAALETNDCLQYVE